MAGATGSAAMATSVSSGGTPAAPAGPSCTASQRRTVDTTCSRTPHSRSFGSARHCCGCPPVGSSGLVSPTREQPTLSRSIPTGAVARWAYTTTAPSSATAAASRRSRSASLPRAPGSRTSAWVPRPPLWQLCDASVAVSAAACCCTAREPRRGHAGAAAGGRTPKGRRTDKLARESFCNRSHGIFAEVVSDGGTLTGH